MWSLPPGAGDPLQTEMPKFVFNGECADGAPRYFAFRAFATCSAVTSGAALPQALRI